MDDGNSDFEDDVILIADDENNTTNKGANPMDMSLGFDNSNVDVIDLN